MYTELVLKVNLKDETPTEVREILSYLFDAERPFSTLPAFALPDHPFFKCDRWRNVGNGSSFYHHPKALSHIDKDYLFSRSDIKNYDEEIEKFLNWLSPYLNEYQRGNCVGWYWYEEQEYPYLLQFVGGEIKICKEPEDDRRTLLLEGS